MLKTNVGPLDRFLWVLLGAALLLAFLFGPDGGWSWLYLLGILPLATGLAGSCPAYTLLGLSTCPVKR